MTHQKSLFNKNLFFEDLKQNKHIMILYTIFLLLATTLPAMIMYNSYLESRHFYMLSDVAEMLSMANPFVTIINTAAAVIFVILQFGYLYKTNSVIFYHSMPITREALLVTKKFSSGEKTYTVRVTTNSHKNGEYGLVTGSGKYQEGETASISAAPNKGYKFLEWEVNGIKTGMTTPSFQFQVTQNMSFVAVFEPLTYTVKTTAVTRGGTVTGAGTYKHGESVTVTAKPESDYIFEGWYENDEKVSTSASYTFKAGGDRNLTAKFLKRLYVNISLPGSQDDSTECGYKIIVDNSVLRKHFLGDRWNSEVSDRLLDELVEDAGNEFRVEIGSDFSFSVVLKEGYKKGADFAVKANGKTLTADENGKYTFKVNAAKVITVEGVVKIEYTPTPVIRYEETDTGIILEASGEGQVTLFVNNKVVSNPYTLELDNKEAVFAVFAIAQARGKEISKPATLTNNSFGSSVVVPVIINDSEHGTVEVDNKYDAPGVETTLTVTPEPGYVLSELIVEYEDEGEVVALQVTEIDGKYQFTRPSSCTTVRAVFVPAAGYTISGTLSTGSDGIATLTLTSTADPSVMFTTTVSGKTGTYSFENVPAGTYTLTVQKPNHVSREYTVKVGS